MGLFVVLGKIGKTVGKGALGFATGGPVGAAIGAGSELLGGGAQASADARREEALIQAQMDAANNRAQLDAAQFNLDAPGQRTGQVARGEVLQTMQDAPLLGDPRIDKFAGGGLRPSAFGPQSRQAGGELSRQALMALMQGTDRVTPTVSQIPESGILERLGGIAGLVGGVGSAIGKTGVLDALTRMGGNAPQGAYRGTPPLIPDRRREPLLEPRF